MYCINVLWSINITNVIYEVDTDQAITMMFIFLAIADNEILWIKNKTDENNRKQMMLHKTPRLITLATNRDTVYKTYEIYLLDQLHIN